MKSEGSWSKDGGIEQLFDHHGKELIIFFTDMYDEDNDLLHFISRLKTPRNEVIVFHIMGEQEMELSYDGSFSFEDLESKRQVKVDTALQQEVYATRLKDWVKETRMWMLEKAITYQLVTMSDSFEKTLRDFLKVRNTLMR